MHVFRHAGPQIIDQATSVANRDELPRQIDYKTQVEQSSKLPASNVSEQKTVGLMTEARKRATSAHKRGGEDGQKREEEQCGARGDAWPRYEPKERCTHPTWDKHDSPPTPSPNSIRHCRRLLSFEKSKDLRKLSRQFLHMIS